MKRNIIFRGLDENNEWVYGGLVCDSDGYKIRKLVNFPEAGLTTLDMSDCPPVKVNPDSIQEYADYCDCSDERNPVFEGDILSIDCYDGGDEKTVIGVVVFEQGAFRVRTSTKTVLLSEIAQHDFRVIGNELTDKKLALQKRIEAFLDSCIPDFEDEDVEGQEMYGIIKQMQEYLQGEQA